MSIRDQMNAIPGYWDDREWPDDSDIPHVHRCTGCGGWIINSEVDNTSCPYSRGDGRAVCLFCLRKEA